MGEMQKDWRQQLIILVVSLLIYWVPTFGLIVLGVWFAFELKGKLADAASRGYEDLKKFLGLVFGLLLWATIGQLVLGGLFGLSLGKIIEAYRGHDGWLGLLTETNTVPKLLLQEGLVLLIIFTGRSLYQHYDEKKKVKWKRRAVVFGLLVLFSMTFPDQTKAAVSTTRSALERFTWPLAELGSAVHTKWKLWVTQVSAETADDVNVFLFQESSTIQARVVIDKKVIYRNPDGGEDPNGEKIAFVAEKGEVLEVYPFDVNKPTFLKGAERTTARKTSLMETYNPETGELWQGWGTADGLVFMEGDGSSEPAPLQLLGATTLIPSDAPAWNVNVGSEWTDTNIVARLGMKLVVAPTSSDVNDVSRGWLKVGDAEMRLEPVDSQPYALLNFNQGGTNPLNVTLELRVEGDPVTYRIYKL